LNGQSVCATLLAVGKPLPAALAAELRAGSRAGLSQVKSVFVARHLGDDSEAARAAMLRVWQAVRPHLLGVAAARRASGIPEETAMDLTPARKRQAADLHRRPAGRAPPRARPEAELPGSGGLITAAIMEGARDGRSVAELMAEAPPSWAAPT
jgi:hypothetical protein